MFDNLKDQIRKENLELIKKKSRYIEHSIQKTHHQIKSNQSKPQSHNVIATFLNQKQREQNGNHDESMSSDSLSDYELEEREEMFNLLIQRDGMIQRGVNKQERFNESSPLYKREAQFRIFSQKYFTPQSKINQYFTPQSKIKQLQRTVQLSEQKLKLTEQSHLRQIQSLNHRHSLTIQEMDLKIQKLQLIIRQQSNKTQRINELLKQNRQLKETLQVYEQKYWKYDELSTLLNKSQQQKLKLTVQNNQLTVQNNQLTIKNNQLKNTNSNKQNKPLKQINQSDNNNDQQEKLRVRQLQRQALRLQNKVSLLQKQSQIQQTHNEQIISNYQLKIQHLQTQLTNKTKTIRQSQHMIQKLNEQRDKLQRSLLFTMDSFSKHLANQSNISQYMRYSPEHIRQKYTKQSPQHIRQKQTQSSLKPIYRIYQQQTINLDLNQSLPKNTHTHTSHLIIETKPYPIQQQKPYIEKQQKQYNEKQLKPYNELNSISPVPIKTIQNYQNTTQYLSHHDYLRNQPQSTSIKQSIQHQNQRTRIMSHQPPHNKRKLSKFIALQNLSYQTQTHNNPEKQNPQKSKINKLQRKLQIANMKIVELLKQKLQKGTKLTFK